MAALSEIEKLEARFNENPDGRFFAPLADAYRKAGRLDDALVMVTSNLPKHPDYLSAHIVLGRCHLDKKDDAAAHGAFSRVLELDAENIIALKSLAEIAERTGQVEDARRWLMRLLAVDQMNAEAEEDLQRLGGPIGEEAPAQEPVETPAFADLGAELEAPEPPPPPPPSPPPATEVATERVPAIELPDAPAEPEVPRTLERPAVVLPPNLKMAEDPTVGFTPPPPPPGFAPVAEPAPAEEPAAAPLMDLEPTSFEPPAEAPAEHLEGSDIVPFDDQLAWDAGDRQSHAIRQEDIAAAEAAHEATASAIDFMGAQPPAEAHEEPAPLAPPPAEPAGVWDQAPPAAHEETGERTVSFEAPVPAEAAPASEPRAAEPPPADIGTSLPLIMPEDVTPPEEMRRPSSRRSQAPAPAESTEPDGQPLITETMGDLYLKQGLRAEAADVYRRLLARRPDDAGLKAKLAALESPPAFSAAALGTEAVGTWLRRVARSALPVSPPVPPEPPAPGPSPMDAAFAEPEPAPVSAPAPAAAPDAEPEASHGPAETPAGEPARPASSAFSLDQIFGASSGSGGTAAPGRAHGLGASFDEFFGASPKPDDTVRPREGDASKPSEDDLSAFTAWLHGLKR